MTEQARPPPTSIPGPGVPRDGGGSTYWTPLVIGAVVVAFVVGGALLAVHCDESPAGRLRARERCLTYCNEKAIDAPNPDASDYFCAVKLCGLDAGTK